MASERVQRRIEERLDRADAAIDTDDWLVVRELAQDVLDLDPENTDAAGLLAMAERRISKSTGPSTLTSSENADPPSPQPSRNLGRV